MIRVAFTLIGGKSWTGGYNYLLNLLFILNLHGSKDIKPVLFLGTDVGADQMEAFREILGLEIFISPLMNANRRQISLLKSLFLGADYAVRSLLREQRIDVVFESAQFYGVRIGIPVIAWIPDFQHRELPHLFSRVAWWKRDLGFKAQIAAGRSIMLSSFDARKSCERYYPQTIGRTHVVRFAIPLKKRPDEHSLRLVRKEYGLPERYFYLPNQFWKHKNHFVVIDALVLLKKAGHTIKVVASGKQFDPNNVGHFDRFLGRLIEADLVDDFQLLGLIPYTHVAPLMVGSVAVLNPSLFEGWSTTVEEARSLNVRLVLSNLAVHREQATGSAIFFESNSAKSLAEALIKAWAGHDFLPAEGGCQNVEIADPIKRFANDFVRLVCDVSNPNPKAS